MLDVTEGLVRSIEKYAGKRAAKFFVWMLLICVPLILVGLVFSNVVWPFYNVWSNQPFFGNNMYYFFIFSNYVLPIALGLYLLFHIPALFEMKTLHKIMRKEHEEIEQNVKESKELLHRASIAWERTEAAVKEDAMPRQRKQNVGRGGAKK